MTTPQTLYEIKAELEKKPFAKSLQGKDELLKLINGWEQELENKINRYDRKISQKQYVEENLRLNKIYSYILNSEDEAKLEQVSQIIEKIKKWYKEEMFDVFPEEDLDKLLGKELP